MAIMEEKIQSVTDDIFADVVESHTASKLFEHLQLDRDAIIGILDNLVAILFQHILRMRKLPVPIH